MGYALGIDLGTTYTAAATFRDGRVEIANLGNRAAAIPSVVLLREDETVLTGEAADRRGISEPERVAREFKRRLGDTTPIFVGGTPYSAEALMSRLLRSVVDEVVTREGSQPDAIAISHPANWGPYKTDLLSQAVRISELPGATLLTEPEAAALHYASTERVEAGQVIAVYDLGGGTFDAAVLRKTQDG
ncbi:heat-shock protein Hsp70, partial [cyanobacterium TDX16]